MREFDRGYCCFPMIYDHLPSLSRGGLWRFAAPILDGRCRAKERVGGHPRQGQDGFGCFPQPTFEKTAGYCRSFRRDFSRPALSALRARWWAVRERMRCELSTLNSTPMAGVGNSGKGGFYAASRASAANGVHFGRTFPANISQFVRSITKYTGPKREAQGLFHRKQSSFGLFALSKEKQAQQPHAAQTGKISRGFGDRRH